MASRDFRSKSKTKNITKYGTRKQKVKKYSDKVQQLIDVYKDTCEYFASSKVNGYLLSIHQLVVDVSLYSPVFTEISVKDIDTLDLAYELHQENNTRKILVLNMASAMKPGGGVLSGKTAQEECLFRRTNAFITHDPSFYTLDDDQIIFSPEITVIKDSNYDKIKPFTVGMISVAALKNPKTRDNNYRFDKDRQIMKQKIKSIFKVALLNKYDNLVLGALGCGVYNNPLDEVFALFEKSINKYGCYFPKITFAILSVGRNGMENYEKFKQLDGKKIDL